MKFLIVLVLCTAFAIINKAIPAEWNYIFGFVAGTFVQLATSIYDDCK